jgi:hypothetical protein
MIKSTAQQMAEPIGFEIGMNDDQAQADLLNGLCKGLSNSMDSTKLGTQLCYITDKLNNNSMRVLSELYEFIKLKSENAKNN